MKKILTVASVLFSTVVFAGGTDENPSSSASGVAVLKNSNSTFTVLYKSARTSDVKVAIHNTAGELVYSEKVKNASGFARPYNFASLPDGDYTISVSDSEGKKVERVALQSGTVTKLVNVKKIGVEGKYLLTAAGKGSESIRVSIFDGQQNLLYTESRVISGDFAQVYNVAKVKGSLSFEIVHENGESKRIDY